MPVDFDPEDGDPHHEIRAGVRKLCAQFPGEYWRKLDREAAYPAEFVKASPPPAICRRSFRRSTAARACRCRRRPRSSRKSSAPAATAPPATPRCTSWARCCGTAMPSRSASTCRGSRPGALRLQAFGVTEPSSGTDTSSIKTVARRDGDHYVVNGQKIWTSRAEHSDLMLLLARTTPRSRSQAHRRAFGLPHRHAGGAAGLTIRPIRTMMNHATTEVFFDDRGSGREPDRRGGQGFPLHALRHECRAHPDRGRVHRRRQMVHRERATTPRNA